MSTKILSQTKKLFGRLNKREKVALLSYIQGIIGFRDANDNILFGEEVKYPHCKSISIIKHGKHQGRQRYRCKDLLESVVGSQNTEA